MLLFKYPIFADICSYIGKISAIEDTFTAAWLREKLYESWGERATLDVPVKNILRTLVDFGALEKVKTGVYRTKRKPVKDSNTIRLIIMTLLTLGKKAYYEVPELSRVPFYFPFEYDVTLEWLQNTPEINIGNFGGKTVITAKEQSR